MEGFARTEEIRNFLQPPINGCLFDLEVLALDTVREVSLGESPETKMRLLRALLVSTLVSVALCYHLAGASNREFHSSQRRKNLAISNQQILILHFKRTSYWAFVKNQDARYFCANETDSEFRVVPYVGFRH